jgi:hypothetical protein
LLSHGYGFATGFSLGNNVPTVVRGEELLEPAPDNVMIVSN